MLCEVRDIYKYQESVEINKYLKGASITKRGITSEVQ